jgi:hypothetical protein
MVDKPDSKPPVPRDLPQTAISASIHAPFLYFEEATTFGHVNGIIQVTLEATRLYPNPPGVTLERVAVAHLRMNVQAAIALNKAIDGALLLAAPSHNTTRS